MKKMFLMIISFIFTVSFSAFAEEEISVILNGERLSFEQAPIIRNDFTLVPFRLIFEELNMTVQWDEYEQKVTAQDDDKTITLFINNPIMIVNDKEITAGASPIIYNDRTFVPLRAVSEAAGADVSWDNETRTVNITVEKDDFENWPQEVLFLVNEEREKNGLSSLEWDDSLARLAEEHCRDMIERNFFSHDNPDGLTPFDRMKNAGISYWAAGENIAAGQSSPKQVFEEWMNSDGHRENILKENFTSIGISVVRGGSYGIYWVQEFAKFKN